MTQDQPYIISGIVVSQLSNEPLVGVEVSYNDDLTQTNIKGEFSLIGVKMLEDLIQISINLPQYVPQTITPHTLGGSIKNDLGVIKLTPNKTNLKIEKLKSSQLDSKSIESLKSKDSSSQQQKSLNNTINNLKSILIPSILGLIAKFGITNAMDYIKGEVENLNPSCPKDPKSLQDLVNTRNKFAKQLNNLYKTVDITTKALGLVSGAVTVFSTAYSILKLLPIPTPPPATPSPVPIIQDQKSSLDINIKKFTKISAGTLLSLTILRDLIQQVLDLLKLLDQQIQNCTEDAELIEINEELRITNDNTTPSITQINGFTMGTETESTTKNLKRKRATAENSQGVILLRGEYSFSSSDQILIDELVFYIQSNDLKAN
tara:strand:+ start:1304 stop:2428 length:1125 start_codon:yes stop_codon:yes gene_type:complete